MKGMQSVNRYSVKEMQSSYSAEKEEEILKSEENFRIQFVIDDTSGF